MLYWGCTKEGWRWRRQDLPPNQVNLDQPTWKTTWKWTNQPGKGNQENALMINSCFYLVIVVFRYLTPSPFSDVPLQVSTWNQANPKMTRSIHGWSTIAVKGVHPHDISFVGIECYVFILCLWLCCPPWLVCVCVCVYVCVCDCSHHGWKSNQICLLSQGSLLPPSPWWWSLLIIVVSNNGMMTNVIGTAQVCWLSVKVKT